jgi:hypothetical protein
VGAETLDVFSQEFLFVFYDMKAPLLLSQMLASNVRLIFFCSFRRWVVVLVWLERLRAGPVCRRSKDQNKDLHESHT